MKLKSWGKYLSAAAVVLVLGITAVKVIIHVWSGDYAAAQTDIERVPINYEIASDG